MQWSNRHSFRSPLQSICIDPIDTCSDHPCSSIKCIDPIDTCSGHPCNQFALTQLTLIQVTPAVNLHWTNRHSFRSSLQSICIDPIDTHVQVTPAVQLNALTQWTLIQVTPAVQFTLIQWSLIQVTPAVQLNVLTQWTLIQVTPAVNLHWPNGHSFRSLLQYN